MNFALLWIDALLIAVLWVAATAAIVGRAKRKWFRALFLPIVIGVPLAVLGTFVFAAANMKFSMNVQPNWFAYSVSLLLAYLIGASVILRRAGRHEPGLPPAAAAWGRVPLALACLTATIVGYMLLCNMDLVIRARCAISSVRVNSIYLAALPAITSDAQNAAPLYEKAFDHLKEVQKDEERIENPPTGNRDDFDPNEPATLSFLAQQAPTIALLRRAAALPGCRFDADLGQPNITVMMPFLNEERNAANILSLEARVEISRGHASSAIADTSSIFRMSRQLGQRPLIISGLVGMGIDSLGAKTLEQVLPMIRNPGELAELRLEELAPIGRIFRQSLRAEEVFGLAVYGNMPDLEPNPTPGSAPLESHFLASGSGPGGAFVRVFFLDVDEYMKLMEDLQSDATLPYFQTITKQSLNANSSRASNGLFTSLLGKSLSQRLLVTCARIEATDACAQTAVAMTRYRLDNGALPSHLQNLVPKYLEAVPTDPFDGQPLRLAIKKNQWIIYSIGPDGKDDGGTEISTDKGDVIFTLKTPTTEPTSRPQ
ncbi:MAG: hypothetical protein M3O30_11420 [Planctomycetota bacterium]|nr:hypothetical protein [Planctomycetota bacterium]